MEKVIIVGSQPEHILIDALEKLSCIADTAASYLVGTEEEECFKNDKAIIQDVLGKYEAEKTKPKTNPSWKQILEKTDWELLRKQKITLIQSIDVVNERSREDLNGILHFIDAIQDTAAEELGGDMIFEKNEDEDEPTEINKDGTKVWRNKKGNYNREDGPAFVFEDGTKFWCLDGLFHREDGPALVWADGREEWYRNGERVDEF